MFASATEVGGPAPPKANSPVLFVTTPKPLECVSQRIEQETIPVGEGVIMPSHDTFYLKDSAPLPPQRPPEPQTGWFAWVRLGGLGNQWERAGRGPYSTIEEATQALAAEVTRRDQELDWRDACVTSKPWSPFPQYAPMAGLGKTPAAAIDCAKNDEFVIHHPGEPRREE